MKGIRTNRRRLNKSVKKKQQVQFIVLTFDQYENILCDKIPYARMCNLLGVNCERQFFRDLKLNKVPEYESWYEMAKENN